jgi:hypothetical protein
LGSATVSVAAVGVPPTALRREFFRPEAESGGRDARAPKKIHTIPVGFLSREN